MSNGKFVRPSVRVFQELISVNPTVLEPFFELCVVGPAYQVEENIHSYNQLAGQTFKNYVAGVKFETAYLKKEAYTDIDTKSVKVRLKNTMYKVWPEYAGASDALEEEVTLSNSGTVTTLKCAQSATKTFKDVSVAAGDIVVIRDNTNVYSGTVLSINPAGNTIRLKNNLYITTTAAPSKQVQIAIVRPLGTVDNVLQLDVFTNGEVSYNGAGITADKVEISELITTTLAGNTVRVYSGDAYVDYRALKTALANDFVQVTNTADIEANIGKNHPDNPLAVAAHTVLNTVNISFKALAVNADNADGFGKALDMLSMTDSVYVLVPLTQDLQIITSYINHVKSMSTPEKGKWRIMYCNTKQPRSKELVEKNNGRLKGIVKVAGANTEICRMDVSSLNSVAPYLGFESLFKCATDTLDIRKLKLDDSAVGALTIQNFTLLEDNTHNQEVQFKFTNATPITWDYEISINGVVCPGLNSSGTITWDGAKYTGFPTDFNYTKSSGSSGSGKCNVFVDKLVPTTPGTGSVGFEYNLFDFVSLDGFKLDNTAGSVWTVPLVIQEDAAFRQTVEVEFTRAANNTWNYTMYSNSIAMTGAGTSGTIIYSSATGLYTGIPSSFVYTPSLGSVGSGTCHIDDLNTLFAAPGIDDAYMNQGPLAIQTVQITGLKLNNTAGSSLHTSFVIQEDITTSQSIHIEFKNIARNSWQYQMSKGGVTMTGAGNSGNITYNTSTMMYTGFPVNFEYEPTDAPNSTNILTLVDEEGGVFMTNQTAPGDYIDVYNKQDNTYEYSLRIIEDGVLNENVVILERNKYMLKDEGYSMKYPVDTLPLTTNEEVYYAVKRVLKPKGIAETLSATAASMNSERIRFVQPDLCCVSIGGVDYDLPGYYIAVAYGAMRAGFPPHQGFTTLGCSGIKRIYHSNKFFKDEDIDLMGGSGVFMVVQDDPTTIPYCLYQTTTSQLNVLEMKEDSIVATVDFASKFYRDNLRAAIGKYNVNELSVRFVATVIRDITDRMKRMTYAYIGPILVDGKIVSIRMDKDKIIPVVNISVPFPVNNIDLYVQY